MDIKERKKALENILQQYLNEAQTLETERNKVITEVVKIQGKLDLITEHENEKTEENKEETKEKPKETETKTD